MSSPARGGHQRIASEERRVSILRRRTKGPQDLDPPLSEPVETDPLSATIPAPATRTSMLPRASTVPIYPMHAAEKKPSTPSTRDFSYLFQPSNFHPLPSQNLLPALQASQPPPTTPLCELLAGGHLRAAAITAANILTSPEINPQNYKEILRLWYIRLSSLTLIGSTTLAAQEIKVLSDLSSNFYRDENGAHIVPWELRILAVRLQAIAYNDWRRPVAAYYELAREARMEAIKPSNSLEIRELWRRRLKDVGIRVGNALVEMGDLAGAARHLEGLKKGDDAGVGFMLGLLYIRIGNVAAARKCFDAEGERVTDKVLKGLTCMAEGRWDSAVEVWNGLVEDDGEDEKGKEMARNNLAVSLLYSGKLEEARKILETLIDSGIAFPGLAFNLTTIYELSSENSKALKMGLVEKVAGHGKEMTNASFKI
ncbi:hypothetical protein RUND412_004219 [Rhizina undulata]